MIVVGPVAVRVAVAHWYGRGDGEAQRAAGRPDLDCFGAVRMAVVVPVIDFARRAVPVGVAVPMRMALLRGRCGVLIDGAIVQSAVFNTTAPVAAARSAAAYLIGATS